MLTMCVKYFDGSLGTTEGVDLTAGGTGPTFPRLWTNCVSLIALRLQHGSAKDLARRARRANRYTQETEPFKLAKTDLEACRRVLLNLAEWLRVAAILIKPFLPVTAKTFYDAFNFGAATAWDRVSYRDAARPLEGLRA